MSMTDGHIFFDIELYNQGKRPAVNPFLSVTRVGHQTQDSLHRDLSQVISNFLVMYEKMKQFMHFGAEVGESSRTTLALGARLDAFLNQGTDTVLSVELNTFMIGLIWAGVWNENETHELKKEFGRYISYYQKEKTYRMKVAELLKNCKQFSDVVTAIKRDTSLVQIP
jgi:F-type H+-transporting ATPase subunit alpha